MTLDTLIREASKLTPAERAELSDALLILDAADGTDVSLTPAQEEDLDRRIEEYRSGRAKMIPLDEALAILRKPG
jgi:putative addiction module component (TIGR02574 family)